MKRLATMLCLGTMAGCSCLFGGGPRDDTGVGGGAGGGGGAGALDPTEIERLEDCSVMTGPVDPALVRDAARTLQQATDGTVDLPLRKDGCWRVKRTMRAGVASSFDIFLDVGLQYDPVTYQPIAPVRRRYLHFERDAQGVLTGAVDLQPDLNDSFADIQVRADPAAARFERTVYDPTSREVAERRVLERTAAGRHRERVERRVNGALVVVRDEELEPRAYRQGGGKTPASCSPAESAALNEALAGMVAQAMGCLGQAPPPGASAASRETVQAFEAWAHASMARVEWFCFPAGAPEKGEWTMNNQLDTGPIQIAAQPGVSDLGATLFHELMHAVQGGHAREVARLEENANDAVARNDRAAYERWLAMLNSTDPVYACESLCFGSPALRNRCTCAACYGVRPCDEPCRSLPSCVRDTVDGMTVAPFASEAVGAFCQPVGISPSTSQISWYSTLAECESTCPGVSSGASSCTSRSRSCKRSCK